MGNRSQKTLTSHPEKMTPHLTRNGRLVSDDDEEEDYSRSQRNEVDQKTPWLGKRKFSRGWRDKLALLTRVGTRGNTRPKLGQMCLTMVGKVNEDLGQIGVVTSVTPCMVAVTSLRANGEDTVSRLKRPSSLILLETGLTLVQDSDGSIWIRSIRKMETNPDR